MLFLFWFSNPITFVYILNSSIPNLYFFYYFSPRYSYYHKLHLEMDEQKTFQCPRPPPPRNPHNTTPSFTTPPSQPPCYLVLSGSTWTGDIMEHKTDRVYLRPHVPYPHDMVRHTYNNVPYPHNMIKYIKFSDH